MPDYLEYKEQMCMKHFGIETVNTEHPNFLIYLRDMQYAPANNEPIHDDDARLLCSRRCHSDPRVPLV